MLGLLVCLATAAAGQEELVPPLLGAGKLLLAPPIEGSGSSERFRVRGGDNLTETLGAWRRDLSQSDAQTIKGEVKSLLQAHAEDIERLRVLRAQASELHSVLSHHCSLSSVCTQI